MKPSRTRVARAAGAVVTLAFVSALAGCGSTSQGSASDASVPGIGSSVVPSAPPMPSMPSMPQLAPWPSVVPSPSPQPLAWGPSGEQWERALADASALTDVQAAGQVIVADFNGTDPDKVEALVANYGLGGVIFMSGAITTSTSVSSLTAAASGAVPDRDWPTMIAVDQEGGNVSRLKGLLPHLPGFMAAGATTDKSLVRDVYASAGTEMRELGFNVNFAPVADMTIGIADPTIRTRSAGDDVENVSATVNAAVDGYGASGVAAVVKHFPGHGSVTANSHVDLPVQGTPLPQLEERDLVPFQGAVDAGVPALMMAHIVLDEWGDGPATVSPKAYAYVREELGFTGVVFTDALNMAAVQDPYDPGEAAVKALAAGADVLLMPPDIAAARDGIVAAVAEGAVPRSRLTEAAARSIMMMRWQVQQAEQAGSAPIDGDTARVLARAGTTVAAQDCEGPFLGSEVTVTGGSEKDRATLGSALEERGISVGDDGMSIALLAASHQTATADVVVALAGPWGLSGSTSDVKIGLYGRSSQTFAALADILVAQAEPVGQWPMVLKGVPAACGG